MEEQNRVEETTDSMKIAKLKDIFAKLKIPIELKHKSRFDEGEYALVVYDKYKDIVTSKSSLERLVARTAYTIFRAIYDQVSEAVNDREKLAYEAYYWIIGYLGSLIREDYPEEKDAKRPKWLDKTGHPLTHRQVHKDGYEFQFHRDHIFFTRKGEYVSEPYQMSDMDFSELIDFCKKFNLEFFVTGESKHFPGHTFRVKIKPKKARTI